MKLDFPVIRAAMAAVGLMSALALPATSQAAGFTFNSQLKCNTTPQMQLDPSGNVSITCTDITTTTSNTSPPTCSLTGANIAVGASATLSASCNPAATGFNWTQSTGNPTGAPAFNPVGTSGSLQIGPFNTAGTYTYSVQGSNGSGAGNTATNSVVVAAAASTPPPSSSGCATGSYPVFTESWVSITLAKGEVKTMQLKPLSAGLELHPIQSTSSPINLTVQFAVSPCPGDFSVPDYCQAYGSVEQGAARLTVWMPAYSAYGQCVLQAGTTYYVNIRNTTPDGTPTCPTSSCNFLFQENGY